MGEEGATVVIYLSRLTDTDADCLSGGAPLTGPRRSTAPSPEKARQYAEMCPPRVDYHAEAQGRAIAVGFIVLLAVSALIAIAL